MRTITLTAYCFDELSEDAKERAISNYRNKDNSDQSQWYYNDAHESIKKFHDIFRTKGGSREWTDFNDGHIDDCILGLKGDRLQRYIWNNYREQLYKGRYHTVKIDDRKVVHKRVKCTGPHKSGKYHNAYYSAVFRDDNCCVLTGVCYDDDLLAPIYEFMDNRPDESVTLHDLFERCFDSIKTALENEDEYNDSEEYISEQLSNSEQEYDEFGGEI